MFHDLLTFLLEFNLSLALGFGLYWWLLRQQTTYQWNRLFLVFWPLLCITIASLQLDYVVWKEAPVTSLSPLVEPESYFIPTKLDAPAVKTESPYASSDYSTPVTSLYWWQLYFTGVLVAIFLFVLRLKRLQKLIGMGLDQMHADYTLLEHPAYSQIFSFGRYIFKQKGQELPEMVLAHELIHVKQRHSFDLLWMQLLIILNWFNPVIYLYQIHLKETHEFIADRAVAQQYGLLEYARLLVDQATQPPVPVLALSFAAFTKKRIIAMKTKTNHRWSRLPYWLILPLLLILVSAFTVQSVEKTKIVKDPQESSITQTNDLLWAKHSSEITRRSILSYPIAKHSITKISSGFGPRIHPVFKENRHHMGIDLVADVGTPVIAAAQGEVIEVEEKTSGYGKKIIIQHPDGLSTLYAQLQSITVKKGDRLPKGSMIGTVGSSGTSTGPHLHFEVRVEGKPKDPMNYLSELER